MRVRGKLLPNKDLQELITVRRYVGDWEIGKSDRGFGVRMRFVGEETQSPSSSSWSYYEEMRREEKGMGHRAV
jgi:hypothetical protein